MLTKISILALVLTKNMYLEVSFYMTTSRSVTMLNARVDAALLDAANEHVCHNCYSSRNSSSVFN